MRTSWRVGRLGADLIAGAWLLMMAIWSLYPVAWVVLSSLKPQADQFAVPPVWWPQRPTLNNYRRFLMSSEVLQVVVNTAVVTGGAVIGALTLGVPMAYALSRFRLRSGEAISVSVLLARMTPPVVMILPFFVGARWLGLWGTQLLLVIVGAFLALPFSVWMMRGFFAEIPGELEEAAMVDGATRAKAVLHVVLPLTAPGLAATAVLCAILVWNEFLFPLVLGGPSARTLPVLVSTYVTEKAVDWGMMSAAGVVTALPLVLFGLLIQRYLVQGLTAGSIR